MGGPSIGLATPVAPLCIAACENVRQIYDNGILFWNSSIHVGKVTDGTSNTFLCGESMYMEADWGSNWASVAYQGCWVTTPTVCSTLDPINHALIYPVYGDPNARQWTPAQFGWYAPAMRTYGSMHVGGTHFLLADGSARFVSENIDMALYGTLGTRMGGEVTGEF